MAKITDIKPTRIIWHHTAVNSERDQFVGINNVHKRRDFPKSSLGFYVGYHYLIEHSGEVKKARENTEIGAHDQNENFGSIGVAMSGNFSLTKPSKAQREAIRDLVEDLMMKYKIPAERVQPHRKNDATECPGKLLPDNWIFRNNLKDRLKAISNALQNIIKEL